MASTFTTGDFFFFLSISVSHVLIVFRDLRLSQLFLDPNGFLLLAPPVSATLQNATNFRPDFFHCVEYLGMAFMNEKFYFPVSDFQLSA